MARLTEADFWRDALAWQGSITPRVAPRVVGFAVYGAVFGLLHEVSTWQPLGVVPAQFTAAILVLLLVLRTNAGYDRWWEARKLWGGIVNQSRNLAVGALTWGPRDRAWRDRLVRWAAAFGHASRANLRGERTVPELDRLLGDRAREVVSARHPPTRVAGELAGMLRAAADAGDLDRVAVLNLERERALLVDHVGGCERILKTPMPTIHTVKVRRFIVLYLLLLPLAAVGEAWWLPGLVTGLVAYALFAIDEIASQLEDPFSKDRLSHLPLDGICATIEGDLLALVEPPGFTPP